MLTVVVTNYRRADKLKRCLESLKAAGIENVVLSSAAPDAEVDGLAATDLFEDFQYVSTSSDYGCNDTWLRGVYAAKTPYVLILHDDDFLLPEFGATYRNLIEPQLNRGVGFASWRGKSVTDEGVERNEDYFSGPTSVRASAVVSQFLLQPGHLSISPVLSVFRREDCIRILKEAGTTLRNKVCFTRPTMVVGNDLLLYLRHAEKYSSWLYVNQVLTAFGKWDGSETVAAMKQKSNPLIPAYDYARNSFLKTRGPAVKLEPRVIHVYSDYQSSNPDVQRRHAYAAKTWSPAYATGKFLPLQLWDGDFTRSSKDLGDTKCAPFVKDIIRAGMAMAMPEDLVVMTNRDTCFVRNAGERLLRVAMEGAVARYAVREDFFHKINPEAAVFDDISHGHRHCGADLVAISPAWWRKWHDWVPDLVLSYEAWDLMARELFAETQPGEGVEMTGLVYHEYHETFWAQPKNRYRHPVQLHVLRQAKNFYLSRGRQLHYSLK